MSFLTAIQSQIGGRNRNDDVCDYVSVKETSCWVLADGVGGHNRGDIAAQIAVDQVLCSFQKDTSVTPQAMMQHMEIAQKAVLERQQTDPGTLGMRTTLVVLISDGQKAIWGHIGDSRLYHLRNGCIEFQSRDQSLVQLQVERGEIKPDEIRLSKDRNLLLEALGDPDKFRPDILKETVRVKPDDNWLLCTDGLWDYVVEQEIEADLAKSPDPADWIRNLEQRVLARADKSHDNYTSVAVFVKTSPRRLPYTLIGFAMVMLFVAIGFFLYLSDPTEMPLDETGITDKKEMINPNAPETQPKSDSEKVNPKAKPAPATSDSKNAKSDTSTYESKQ